MQLAFNIFMTLLYICVYFSFLSIVKQTSNISLTHTCSFFFRLEATNVAVEAAV
jgi:diacylglycerol kinase